MKLGKHSYVGKCELAFHPDVTIGNYTGISSGVIFMGRCQHPSGMDKKVVSNFPFVKFHWGDYVDSGCRGPIVIGSDVWVGMNVTIMDNVHIGNGVIIGTGAIVTKNVPDYAVVVGNTGRIVRMRFPPDIIEELLKIAWWNWSDDKVKSAIVDMRDVNIFVKKYKL